MVETLASIALFVAVGAFAICSVLLNEGRHAARGRERTRAAKERRRRGAFSPSPGMSTSVGLFAAKARENPSPRGRPIGLPPSDSRRSGGIPVSGPTTVAGYRASAPEAQNPRDQ